MATKKWGDISAPYRATAKARAKIEEEKRKIEATVARSELHQEHMRTIGARRQARDAAREALELARNELVDACRAARADGLTLEEIGQVLGITKQAVAQLVKQA